MVDIVIFIYIISMKFKVFKGAITMTNKKILITMSTCALAGMLFLGGNAYANYPQDYNGASASSLTFVAEGTATYSGNIVTLPVKINQEKEFNFTFDDVNELYVCVTDSKDELDSSIEAVDNKSGIVNISFDLSRVKLDTPYTIHVYTQKMFGKILEPEEITFKMDDKIVNISSEGKLLVTKNNDVVADASEKIDEQKQEKATKEEQIISNESKTNHKINVESNTPKKTLPATKAVR